MLAPCRFQSSAPRRCANGNRHLATGQTEAEVIAARQTRRPPRPQAHARGDTILFLIAKPQTAMTPAPPKQLEGRRAEC